MVRSPSASPSAPTPDAARRPASADAAPSPSRATTERSPRYDSLHRLQQSVGNRAVVSLLRDAPDAPLDRRWAPGPGAPERGSNLPTVVQRGKAGAGKKAVGWIVKVGERKLIKRAAIYTEKEMAQLLGKGYNVLVKRGKSVAKRVSRKVWGKDVIHHSGHIIKKTGKLGRPHFQPKKSLLGRPGEKGWHIFYGVAPVLFFAEDVEAMAIYEDKYPGPSVAHNLTISKHVSKDSWLRHLDWVNPGELIAIAGDVGRKIDRELSKELKAIVFTRQAPDGTVQTYELDPEGQLVRVIVVGADGTRRDFDADTYFGMLAAAVDKTSGVPVDDGTKSKHFESVFDATYRIYHSKQGWAWERKTLSFFLPRDATAKLQRVGRFYVNLNPQIRYLYVIVPPKDRALLGQPGFLVPKEAVADYLKAGDQAGFLERHFEVAQMLGAVKSLFGG